MYDGMSWSVDECATALAVARVVGGVMAPRPAHEARTFMRVWRNYNISCMGLHDFFSPFGERKLDTLTIAIVRGGMFVRAMRAPGFSMDGEWAMLLAGSDTLPGVTDSAAMAWAAANITDGPFAASPAYFRDPAQPSEIVAAGLTGWLRVASSAFPAWTDAQLLLSYMLALDYLMDSDVNAMNALYHVVARAGSDIAMFSLAHVHPCMGLPVPARARIAMEALVDGAPPLPDMAADDAETRAFVDAYHRASAWWYACLGKEGGHR